MAAANKHTQAHLRRCNKTEEEEHRWLCSAAEDEPRAGLKHHKGNSLFHVLFFMNLNYKAFLMP